MYLPRVVDDELDELFSPAGGLAAIAIEGPRAVGKTETARRRAKSAYHLDDPDQLEILRADPHRIARGGRPVLIDEWQRFPPIWDVVRRAVDSDRTGGQFLLTGSAAPTERPTHTGAGRIVTLRMRPLSLMERGLVKPTVSLGQLLGGERPSLTGASSLRLVDYAEEIVVSGFPAIRRLNTRARRVELDGYIERIVERDFEEQGRRVRDEGALRRWMTAFAASTSTTASYETLRSATASGAAAPTKVTSIAYRRILEQLWILDELPAWLPTRNRFSRLASAPRHHLADPALAARLLGVGVDGLIDNVPAGPEIPRDGTLLGALFESLAAQSVRVYAQGLDTRVAHLRTHSGDREIDMIVERGDGRVVAVEVKLSQTVDDRDVRHLLWLGQRIGDDLLDAIVLTTGAEAYRRPDGIGVVPLALLGP